MRVYAIGLLASDKFVGTAARPWRLVWAKSPKLFKTRAYAERFLESCQNRHQAAKCAIVTFKLVEVEE